MKKLYVLLGMFGTLVGVYIDVSYKVWSDLYEEIIEVLHNCLWFLYKMSILHYDFSAIVTALIFTCDFVDHAPRFPDIRFIFCKT